MKNTRKVGQFLFGSIAVYLCVAMAHGCGGEGTRSVATSSGSHAMGGSGASTGSSAGGKGGAGGIMNPVGDAVADSGSRLRAKWFMGEDGSKEFAGWYDKQRGEDCWFIGALDAERRCLPIGNANVAYYAEALCQVPLVSDYTNGCNVPKYGLVIDAPSGCKPAGHIHPVGAAFNGPTIWTTSGGSCQGTPNTSPYPLYVTGDEIPASAFVSATIAVD